MAEAKSVNLDYKYVDPEGGIKENKNPVIFLHAMLCSKEVWVDVPQTVANNTGRRVYTYDARNHGDSEAREDSNFTHNVDDLFFLMDKIKAEMDPSPEQFILVGHDMGGMTAMRAALKENEKVEKLFIVEMYARNVDSEIIDRTKIFTTKWAECVRKIPGSTPPEDVARLSVDDLYKELDESMKEENEKESFRKANFSFKKTGDHYDVKYHTENINKALEELKEAEGYEGMYTGATYFFFGEESHYKVSIVKNKEAMIELFPFALLVPFRNGSHFFIADVPADLANALIIRINLMHTDAVPPRTDPVPTSTETVASSTEPVPTQ